MYWLTLILLVLLLVHALFSALVHDSRTPNPSNIRLSRSPSLPCLTATLGDSFARRPAQDANSSPAGNAKRQCARKTSLPDEAISPSSPVPLPKECVHLYPFLSAYRHIETAGLLHFYIAFPVDQDGWGNDGEVGHHRDGEVRDCSAER